MAADEKKATAGFRAIESLTQTAPSLVYANVINFQLNSNELILDFGAIFTTTPPPPGTSVEFQPTIRVVMPAGAIDDFATALQHSIKVRDEAVRNVKSGQSNVRSKAQ